MNLLVLLVLLQTKHFLADFVFQSQYMLRKDLSGWAFAPPLLSHCLVHAVFTLFICLAFAPLLWWLAALDFGMHFITDRVRSSPRLLGRHNDFHKRGYWIVLGLDQWAHNMAYVLILWLMMRLGYFS